MKIPWNALSSRPVEVNLNGLYLLIKPINNIEELNERDYI